MPLGPYCAFCTRPLWPFCTFWTKPLWLNLHSVRDRYEQRTSVWDWKPAFWQRTSVWGIKLEIHLQRVTISNQNHFLDREPAFGTENLREFSMTSWRHIMTSKLHFHGYVMTSCNAIMTSLWCHRLLPVFYTTIGNLYLAGYFARRPISGLRLLVW